MPVGQPAVEAQLRRTLRMLRTLSECNQSLVRSRDEQELLQQICDHLVQVGGYRLAWVGYAEDARAEQICPMASAGDSDYLDLWDQAFLGQGLAGRVIREAQVFSVAEIDRAPDLPSCSEEALRRGLNSTIALPLLRADVGLWGVLRLYSTERDAFDPEEHRLLQELAGDLAFGIATHRTRHQLADSEALFRALSDESLVGMYMIRDGAFSYANPRFCEIFGYDRQQLARLRVPDLVAPEDRQRVAENLRRRIDGEIDSLNYDFTALRADGQRIQVEVFGSRAHFDGADVVVGTLLDITERRRSEEQLRLMSRAIEASSNGIAISDLAQPDNPFVYINPAFERITGYTADEALGRNGRFLLGDDLRQPDVERLRVALRERRGTRLELRNYHKSGSLFWNELSVAPVRDEQGKVTHYVSVFSDITERKHYEQQLEQLSNYDSTTGLANRNLLRDRLGQSLIQADRTGRGCALAMLDLDRFKTVTHTLGAEVGDQVLRIIGQRIAGCVRPGDTVARLGGDEYAVVFHDIAQEEDIVRLVSQILEAIAEPLPLGPDGMIITASMGIAVAPRDGEDGEALLRNADVATFRAMEQRNCFRFYTREMNEAALDRLALEMALRGACERGEMRVHYQPKVHLPDGQIRGAEALVRWQHPERGLLPPGLFIGLAEECGLIDEIGDWVLREACRQTAEWSERIGRPLSIAVNLSAEQFRQPGLAETIATVLGESGLSPEQLECELTESTIMQDPAEAAQVLAGLKQLGIRIALDDFGTGYSSLSYLKRFPLNTLKIDRSFVQDIPGDPNDEAIARAINALARTLGLDVVAEGVETGQQLAFLLDDGCCCVQGFLFSKPLPAEDFYSLLQRALPFGAQLAGQ